MSATTAIRFGASGALLLILGALRPLHAGAVADIEPNNAIGTAQNVDSAMTLDFSPIIGNSAGTNTSTTYPNATVLGFGDGTFDYYSFMVPVAGALGIFDIDFANFDAELFLFAPDGTLIAENDDSPTTLATDAGSSIPTDPFIQHVFAAAGTHVVGVGEFNSIGSDGGISGNTPDLGEFYLLNISVSQTAVPEPTSVILFGSGVAGLLFYRRRRQRRTPLRS